MKKAPQILSINKVDKSIIGWPRREQNHKFQFYESADGSKNFKEIPCDSAGVNVISPLFPPRDR